MLGTTPISYNSTPSTQKNGWLTTQANNNKFQQEFFRTLKEENEKLKATIRLL